MKIAQIALIIIFLVGNFLNPTIAAAQITPSNQVCTKVGTTDKPNPCSGGGGVCNKTPSVPGNYRQSLVTDFGIVLDSRFDAQHTQWTWENFCQVANTRFNELVRGTNIHWTTGISRQTPGKNIELGAYPTQEYYRVVLFHELGHVIRNNASREDSHWTEHLQALSGEGAITTYPEQLCTYSAGEIANQHDWLRQSEDYAELITYYLNPNSRSQTTIHCSVGGNPYANGGKPLHFAVARAILGVYP